MPWRGRWDRRNRSGPWGGHLAFSPAFGHGGPQQVVDGELDVETLVASALWGGAALGVVAVIVAIRQPSKRRVGLLLAALLFLPIGVLGVLSVGAVFLVAAAACLAFAVFGRPSRTATPT